MSVAVWIRPMAVALLLGLFGSAASAQAARAPAAVVPAGAGPAWAALTAQQRSVLAPLQRDWHTIDPAGKAKWLEVAARFPTLPADERQRVQARMAEWTRMSPAARGRARLNFQESKQFTREQKQQRWEAYQALPVEQQQALAGRTKPGTDARSVTSQARPLDAAVARQTAAPVRPAASAAIVKPVAPSIVQAKPGATTTLMTRPAKPPPHQQPGQPKIAAQPEQVNRKTLLPQQGPQAAAAAPASRQQP